MGQVSGRRGGGYMPNKGAKVRYSDNPELGELEIVEDFLPPPEQLIFRPKGVKVTLILSEDSVNFFKEQGERLHTPYQRMIRNLLDQYVQRVRQQRDTRF
jgi:hypothetical protein